MKKILAFCIGVIALSSCYNDKADQLYPVAGGCDTTTATFAKDVLPVMQQKCATSGCHDATTKQSGYNLGTYLDVKQCVADMQLLGVIRQTSGFKAMPQGAPKLDDCTINKITRWVNLGAQNN